MPYYMNYNSLAIKGDVTESTHVGWIELNSFNWGVGRGISAPTGAAADRESSAPSVSELTVTKDQDSATVALINEALQGEGQTVIIDCCKTNQGTLEVFLTFTLTNTMISGYSANGSGDRPAETVTLNFTQVEVKSTPMGATNDAGSPTSVTYDLAQAKVM
jgi:type VI secretion system secreted protein Hcp